MKKYLSISIVIIICFVLLAACQLNTTKTTDNTPLAEAFISVWNTGDIASLDELLSPDFVRESTSTSAAGEIVSGIEAMKKAVLVTRNVVSEFNFWAEEIIQTENGVVMRCRLSGIFNQTGLPIDVKSIQILKISDGKITEQYGLVDHLDLYIQAGMKVVPPEE
ncbi:MAG: ester cyclase [Prolixibacteraceae bacterium]|nr:ester cyclase [Prolixibacteraceae bacterium]